MAYIFDLALLVICGCSTVYCWTLSRRLRALQNLRSGMGKAVVSLTQSVNAVETNAAKLNREASITVLELQNLLKRVEGSEAQIDDLLETMDKQSRETWKEYKKRTEDAKSSVQEASDTLSDLMGDAKEMAKLMNEQLIAMASVEKGASAEKRERASVAASAAAPSAAQGAQVKLKAVTTASPSAAPSAGSAVLTSPRPRVTPEERAAAEKAIKAAKMMAAQKLAAARQAATLQTAQPSAPPASKEQMPTPPEDKNIPFVQAQMTEKRAAEKSGAAPRVAAVARRLAEDGSPKVVRSARTGAAAGITQGKLAPNPYAKQMAVAGGKS
ncbi:MAG: hypothetical protein AAF723_05275 [Pseudomonadota bacterium]